MKRKLITDKEFDIMSRTHCGKMMKYVGYRKSSPEGLWLTGKKTTRTWECQVCKDASCQEGYG